ncbi:hypothetical protein WJU16_20810 [Chitinophaga pollutisoli]|uniref:Ig-like domain-containing protein n=1 Tax=Chitinophaga pollutisoli TaxID=3133966 RepID=A0ABZ2YKX7_9BACT
MLAQSPSSCPRYVRHYAVSESHVGLVTQEDDAVGGDLTNASTLKITLLSGTAKQWLDFGEKIPGGTRVYVKVSTLNGVLALLPNFTIQGYVNSPGKPVIAEQKLENPQLLGLANGTAILELSLAPNQDFDGIVITVNGVGLAFSMQVYAAYILKETTLPIACEGVADVLSGVLPGLNALGLGEVAHPERAADNDLATFAEMKLTLNIGSIFETVIFNTPAMPGDSVRVVLEWPEGNLLDLLLLGGFSIQPHLGDVPVPPAITNAATGLQLRLLAPGSTIAILTAPVSGSFDRVEIKLTAVAGLLLNLKLYEVSRLAKLPVTSFALNGAPGPDPVCITQAAGISLSVAPAEGCALYRWYNGTTLIGTGTTVSPSITTAGLHTFNVEAQRTGCTNREAHAQVSVNVIPKAGPPAVTIQNNP